MIQEIAKNHNAGKPYKLDTAIFYLTNPVFSSPDTKEWEKALAEIFVVDTSPFPSETSVFADILLPDHTFLERLQDAPTYPFQGWPLAQLRVPAVKPLYDTKYFGDTLIELGKRMKGPMADFYKKVDSSENIIRHIAKGFEKDPGDNGVNSFESWKEKGVWYKKTYKWQQRNGEFYEHDGAGYNKLMTAAEVKDKLLKTPSGKFEFKSGYLESKADWVTAKTGRAAEKFAFPHWEEPKYQGGGDLHLITPKMAMHAEGRSANMPVAVSLYQPSTGGRKGTQIEIHPAVAGPKGIRTGDKVRIKSSVGSIEATAKVTELTRPDVLVLPFGQGHWAHGRWASKHGSHVNEVTVQQSDRVSGMANYYTTKVSIERA
jgi:anaerobic selenocysteine-containing dehydrogenase